MSMKSLAKEAAFPVCPPTILFHPPNGYGLGHINRLVAIALAVRKRRPDAALPFVLRDGNHSLLETASLPYVYLPHGPQLLEGQGYSAWGASVVFEASRALIQGLGPELILFDTRPCIPLMDAAAKMNVPMALCARKTKDDQAYFDGMLSHETIFDLLIIPHEPGEVDVPARLLPRTRFVGNVVRPTGAAAEHKVLSRPKRLVITGGGGGYPKTADFYNLAIESYAKCRRKDPQLACTLITGPLFREWEALQVVEGVRVIPFEPRLQQLMASAALVICQGGYNTVAEIKQLDVPCICVPAVRALDDQFARAREAAKSAAHFRVYEGNDPSVLADLVESCLASPRSWSRKSGSVADGADRAAAVLLDYVAHRRPSARQTAESTPNEREASPDPQLWGMVRRNELCPCGSGKRYKHCHGR
jgi:predicted glycosyltransferase